MTDWKDELRQVVRGPEAPMLDAKEKQKAKVREFVTNVITPALNEIKVVLEDEGATVEVLRDSSFLALLRADGLSNPIHTHITYIARVSDDDNKTVWCELSFRSNGSSTKEEIKVGSNFTSVKKSNIGKAFIQLFKKMTE